MKNSKYQNRWNRPDSYRDKIGGIILLIILCSFSGQSGLKGTWVFAGDITNGKKQAAPTEYTLQRKYSSSHFDAFLIEQGSKPEKYEAGDYVLKGDSCFETQTFSSGPSKLMGVTVHYSYRVRNDTLFLSGTLPGGAIVEEHWKKVK